jgi:hypothetical protein
MAGWLHIDLILKGVQPQISVIISLENTISSFENKHITAALCKLSYVVARAMKVKRFCLPTAAQRHLTVQLRVRRVHQAKTICRVPNPVLFRSRPSILS